MKVVPESTMVERYDEDELPTLLPLIRMSTMSTVYEPPPLYGIQWAEALSEGGTVPPSTMAPTVSERHIEKTLGDLVPSRM